MSDLHEQLLAELATWADGNGRHTPSEAALRAVLDLHKPVPATASDGRVMWLDCKGCDPGAHAESDAMWPCTTVETIARELNIEVTDRD